MKYRESAIVLLNDGRTVLIISVNEKNKEYLVCDVDNGQDCFTVKEASIFSLVTQA